MRNSFTRWTATNEHYDTNTTGFWRMLCFSAALILCTASLSGQNFTTSNDISNSGTSPVVAKSDGDLAILLKKIVDLPELQPYYPLDSDKRVKPLVVMQHGVSFPERIPVAHNSTPLIFKSKQEAINEPAYFLFWRFDIAGDKARVEFSYIYDAKSPEKSAQKAELVFDKTGNLWTVASSNIQKTQL